MTTSRTYSPRPRDIERRWYVVDADGAVLGRLASEVASILRGKHKPIYAPHADTGDHVIVINAGGVRLTGGKETAKMAYRHSGYPGGLTAVGYTKLMAERPVFVVEKAIKGMLPKNRLGRSMARKLMVYAGAEHPHEAQKPAVLTLGEVPPWNGLPTAEPAREPAGKKAAPKGRADASRPAPKGSGARAGGTRTRSTAKPAAKTSASAKSRSAKPAAGEAESTKTKRASRRTRKQAEKE
jgi:large subunit ribosomal protein L13